MKSTIKYYRGICSGLHSHLYSMGGIFTERRMDLMTVDEYRALLDTEKRQQKFIRKVGNPYMMRVGKMKVKVSFANNGVSIEEAFKNMLLTV